MADQKDKARGSLEEALLRELRFGALEKETLGELVAIAAGIHLSGLKGVRVFPKGIPVIDGLRISGIVEASDASKVLGEILQGTRFVDAVHVFPYGIPRPEIFRLNVDLAPSRV